MKKNVKEIMVGLVTVLGIMILVIAIIWGKNLSGTVEFTNINIKFETINNLLPGDKIFVRGVDVGTINTVKLNHDNVLVTAEIDKSVQIYQNATAKVVNKELMGGRVMILELGQNTPLYKEGDFIKGLTSKSITETVADLGTLVGQIEGLLSKVDNILPKQNLDVTINEFNDLARSLKKDIGELKSGARTTLSKADVLMDSLTLAVKQGKQSISAIGDLAPDFQQLSVKLNSFIGTTDVTVKNLNEKINMLQDTTSTIGKMFTSPEMYQQLKKTINGIDSLARQIKKEGFKANIDLF